MRVRSLVIAVLLASATSPALAVHACSGGVPEAPVAVTDASQFAPDYSQVADDTTPEAQARATAWREYQHSVFAALRQSAEPRDWALASLVGGWPIDEIPITGKAPTVVTDLLQRAVRAAPNDALVQWIALMQAQRHDSRVSATESVQALQRLEPDNAAVWMNDLTKAMRQRDHSAVDGILARMSADTRFDLHDRELTRAVIEAYQRQPVPATFVALDPDPQRFYTRPDLLPLTAAMAVTAAFAMPSFQELVNACRINPKTGDNAQRANDCAAIGRLMIARGDTTVANRIGAVLLRISHTVTDEDRGVMRDQDWVYQQFLAQVSKWDNADAADEITAHIQDTIDSPSELEAMRRTVARSGASLTPASDWVDAYSPFATERLQKDAEWFDKNPQLAK